MTTENRRQHYLPATYLSQFSLDPSQGRRARILRIPRSGASCEVSAESQCAQNYFYSEDTAAEKAAWGALESDWRPIVTESFNAQISGTFAARLAMQLISLAVRNAAFENASSDERLEITQRVQASLFFHAGIKVGKAREAPVLPPTWRGHVIKTVEEHLFIASDNPVIFFGHPSSNRLSCLGAPLSSRSWAFVYDLDLWISPHLGPPASPPTWAAYLNHLQCVSSHSAVYFSSQIDKIEELCARYFQDQQAVGARFTDKVIHAPHWPMHVHQALPQPRRKRAVASRSPDVARKLARRREKAARRANRA